MSSFVLVCPVSEFDNFLVIPDTVPMRFVIDIFRRPSKKRRRRRVVFGFSVQRPVLKRKGFNMPLELSCTNEQKVQVSVAPVTLTGKPAQLDGPVAVTVVAGAGTVQMVDDRTFFVVSSDDPGDTTFLVDGDADLGEGREDVQDTITLHVAGARAANLGLVAQAPVAK